MSGTEGHPRLVGDVGGTHARFAIVARPGGKAEQVATLRCADFASLGDALQHYLAGQQAPAAPREGAIGVATPVTGDHVKLTNAEWSFSTHELQQRLGLRRLLVLNDFTTLALALPALPAHELRQVGGGKPVAGAPRGLIGPGTGLGVSGLLPVPGGGEVAIGGEGGHVTLAAADADEAAVLAMLQQEFGHVSAERAVSGPGLENLYRGVLHAAGMRGVPLRPAHEITQAALAGTDSACVRALTMFCSLLGQVAGNLALTLGARGGVYIGGGIVPRLGAWFDRSPFRERFEAKGRFAPYLAAIPVYVVQSEVSPALIGASRALDLMAA